VLVLKYGFIFQTSVPVPSPGAGVIEERFVEDGATVKAGEKLFKLKLTGIFIVT
jgi:2-oxoglutarate dehydrogenase E2 component (dihydrolipoamide succinyltransferase)